MLEDCMLCQIPIQYALERAQLSAFLNRHSLLLEQDVDVAFGIYTGDKLMGCGCAAKALLKCFAVDDALRGQNMLGLLISALVQNRFSMGYYDLFLITPLQNEPLFTGCGFYPIVHTDTLVMLENCSNGIDTFVSPLLEPDDKNKTVGAIVMNCNPFTLGHLALVEYGAARCEALHLFVVKEDCSTFSADARLNMVLAGTAHLPHVRVHFSGPYMISAATFPTYFLKANEDAAALQAKLDITLFAQRIAPALHITKRFAGQEPFDPITASYHHAMEEILPQHGILFCQIPRITAGGQVISASRVRSLLKEKGICPEVLELVPESTSNYLMANHSLIALGIPSA